VLRDVARDTYLSLVERSKNRAAQRSDFSGEWQSVELGSALAALRPLTRNRFAISTSRQARGWPLLLPFAGLAAAHRLGEALGETAAFAFAIGNSEAGVTVTFRAGQRPDALCVTYFFFRRFVVFFLAARFAFFFVFFFAAIGMSIDSFDPQRCPGRATRPPKTSTI
jgi:hypothetical protein